MAVLLRHCWLLSPGLRTVQECLYVRRARQGESADLSQSDRGNDPTNADLIWWSISDPVMLPSATCALFKFPAAVSHDRWREISGDGVLGDTGLWCSFSIMPFSHKTNITIFSFSYMNVQNTLLKYIWNGIHCIILLVRHRGYYHHSHTLIQNYTRYQFKSATCSTFKMNSLWRFFA